MTILHYIPSIDRSSGGVGVFMQLLAKPLGKLCSLHIVTHREDNPVEIENAEVHYVSPSVFGAFRRQWTSLLDELQPDVVHVNTCWLPMSALAQKVAQKRGYKVVLSPHGMLEPWIVQRHYWTRKVPAMLLYQRKAVVDADMLHATADSERDNLVALGWNRRITVIPNGVDVTNIEMKLSWVRRRKILFLSRVHVKKGIDFLIEAVAQLHQQLQGYEVIVAGEGDDDYAAALVAKAKALKVDDVVKIVGGVYDDKKWQLMREADVFVLPTHSENFGIVVAEALASGTPVITTTGTPWSELNDRHCGWQTEVGTAPLVAALTAFMSLSDSDLETMGRNGRQLIEERYSTESVARMMVEMYRRM